MKDNIDSKITEAAGDILGNPLMVRKLCDRVYELWLEDLRQQRERSHRIFLRVPLKILLFLKTFILRLQLREKRNKFNVIIKICRKNKV